jgi:hypothetical protein
MMRFKMRQNLTSVKTVPTISDHLFTRADFEVWGPYLNLYKNINLKNDHQSTTAFWGDLKSIRCSSLIALKNQIHFKM